MNHTSTDETCYPCYRCYARDGGSDGLCDGCRTTVDIAINEVFEHPVALGVLGLSEVLDIYYKKGKGFSVKAQGEATTLNEAMYLAQTQADLMFPILGMNGPGKNERQRRAIGAMREGVKCTLYGQLVDKLTTKRFNEDADKQEALNKLKATIKEATVEPCLVPPEGWACTRGAGHPGPCAAVPLTPQAAVETGLLPVPIKPKVVVRVFHTMYGCDTGCCGHVLEVDGDEVGGFQFDHPDSSDVKDEEALRAWAKQLFERRVSKECLNTIDWDSIDVSAAKTNDNC